MAVHSHKERTFIPFFISIFTDGLGNGEYMVFIETFFHRATAMAGSTESDLLGPDGRVRYQRKIVTYQPRQVYDSIFGDRLSR